MCRDFKVVSSGLGIESVWMEVGRGGQRGGMLAGAGAWGGRCSRQGWGREPAGGTHLEGLRWSREGGAGEAGGVGECQRICRACAFFKAQLEGFPHLPVRPWACLVSLRLTASSRVPLSPVRDSELGYLCPWHQPQALSQHLRGACMGEWMRALGVIFGGQSSTGRIGGWQLFGAL